jgi:predicted protein tyrosine phosphatase
MEQTNHPQPAQAGKDQQIQIKITDEILKGAYSNQALISHTATEFILDFINIYPAQAQGIITSKVIMSPAHMKSMIIAMQDNLKKYEEQFGPIEAGQNPANNFGFRTE